MRKLLVVGAVAGICAFPAGASASHISGATYSGSFTTGTTGATVELTVSPDGTAVDFSANGFGQPTCESSGFGTDDIAISGHAFDSFVTGPPNRVATGFFDGPGRASGTARIFGTGFCDSGTQSWSAETPIVWPDGLIGRSSDADQLGDDIYNTSAAGQTRKWKAKPRQKRTFELPISNDGTVTGNVVTKGCKSSRKFKVKYAQGGENVTAVVTGAGLLTNLESGESSTVLLSMKPTRKAQPGNRKRCNVTTRAGDFADTVRAELKAKSG